MIRVIKEVIAAFIAAIILRFLKPFLVIIGLILLFLLLLILDHRNIGPIQEVPFGPPEAVADSDHDGTLDDVEVEPNNSGIKLTKAEATATAVATVPGSSPTPTPAPVGSADTTPTETPLPTETPTAAPSETPVPTNTPVPSPSPTPTEEPLKAGIPTMTAVDPTQEATAPPDVVECTFRDGRVDVVPKSECINGSSETSVMPQTEEDVRQALNIQSPQITVGPVDNGWVFSTLMTDRSEFTLDLPAGVCVDYDPRYETSGAKHMLARDSYDEPAIITNTSKRVKLTKPASLQSISIATVRWDVPCTA
jgi:hypothetical protein